MFHFKEYDLIKPQYKTEDVPVVTLTLQGLVTATVPLGGKVVEALAPIHMSTALELRKDAAWDVSTISLL